jgi:tRNA-2-methylthio-N6-dimethylallyladenosine synthase
LLAFAIPSAVALTADAIVGFPGETEEQFQNTLRFVEEIRFDQAFMFAYSPRDPTPAAKLPEQLTQKEKIRRLEILIALQNKIAGEINEAQVAEGRILDVLVEGRSHKDADYAMGQTRGGKTVHFLAGRDFTGKTVQVKVTQAFMWGFIGDLV